MTSTETATTAGFDSSVVARRIHELWDGEGCDWKLTFEQSFATDGWWNVYLEWTTEFGNPHGADWVTYTWSFYDQAAEVALNDALAWLEALAQLAPCRECDGLGEWNDVPCRDCQGTGLANG